MKIAVLGSSPVAGACASVLRSLGVLVAVVTDVDGDARERSGTDAEIHGVEGAAELLAMSNLDGVVFASRSPESRLIARRLVAQRVPLLVVPDASLTSSFAYEMIPVIEESPGVVTPLLPLREVAAVVELQRRLRAGQLGTIRLLRMSRTFVGIDAPNATASGRVELREIDRAFLHDVDLLRFLGGEYKRVTAVQVGESGATDEVRSVTEISVNLATESRVEGLWRGSGGADNVWRLEVIGDRGRAILQGGEEGTTDVGLEVNGVVEHSGQETREQNGLLTAMQRFVDAIPAIALTSVEAQDVHAASLVEVEQVQICKPVWTDVVRAFDLMDAVHRSLRRQRTVVLQFEETSAQGQFKSQMTAIGCAVIVWSALGLVIGLGVGKAIDPRDAAQRLAEAEGMVLREADFVDRTPQMTPTSQSRLRTQATKSKGRYVVIEASTVTLGQESVQKPTTPHAGGNSLDRERLQVVKSLFSLNDNIVVGVREFKGDWYRRVMQVVWGLVFAPLGLFLLVQLMYPLSGRTMNDDR